mgnify:CR=1 FL=1|jgi:hypothetical protein|tara:strand:+ start:135 stop:353 length:219 start_codon:yes stop_codon:yes gene_type:complete
MKYTLILAEEVSSVDFSQVLETSEDTLRYNNERSQALLKFDGETPSFLEGKTLYDYEEIMEILDSPDWTQEN